MKPNLTRLATAGLLAATLWLAGCSDGLQTSGELLSPQSAQLNQGNAKGLSRYKKVVGTVPSRAVLVDSALIGASGGTLSAAGYQLFIPGGAVNRETKFKMEAMSDGTIGVRLTATRTDARGRVTDVGSLGFRKPVTLSLYYGWASDEISDPGLLTIVWLKDNGQMVAVKSFVSPESQRVLADLSHFSDYIMAIP